MKLPEDKKERAKVLILIAMGTLGILYGLGVGVLSPLVKNKKENIARSQDLETKIQKARAAVSGMQRSAGVNVDVVRGVVEAANRRKFVLHDRLGNYLLGAQEVLDVHARKSGVVLDSVSEIGQSQVPGNPTSTNGASFRSYTVRVTLKAGLHDLIRFLTEVETNNPYLCVSSLSIAGQTAKPDIHDITLDVQWPVWANADMSAQIEAQLKELEQSGGETSSVTNSVRPEEASRP